MSKQAMGSDPFDEFDDITGGNEQKKKDTLVQKNIGSKVQMVQGRNGGNELMNQSTKVHAYGDRTKCGPMLDTDKYIKCKSIAALHKKSLGSLLDEGMDHIIEVYK